MKWSDDRSAAALLAIAFLATGLLIGTSVAFSDEKLTQGLLAAIFALFGGSLLALLQKLSVVDQIKAAVALCAISLGTLLGIYSGLYVNEFQLLTPMTERLSGRNVHQSGNGNSTDQRSESTPIPDSQETSKPTSKAESDGSVIDGVRAQKASVANKHPRNKPTDRDQDLPPRPEKYLRKNEMGKIDAIDQQYRNGLSPREAYEQLLEVVRAETK
jgi:hypothetical protein